VDVRGIYDGILFWECPSCLHAWPRFKAGTALHRRGLEAIGKRLPDKGHSDA
jgi:hypothetical protein